MNYIGIFVPKIITLIIILTPLCKISRIHLFLCWLIKCAIDYDVAHPGHSGFIYRISSWMHFDFQCCFMTFIQLIPAIAFVMIVAMNKCWLALIPGGISVIFYGFQFFDEVKGCFRQRR